MAVRKPKDGGAASWHQHFYQRGAPAPGQRGFVAEPCPGAEEQAQLLEAHARRVLDDPDVGPWVPALWALAGIMAAQDMVSEDMLGADAWGWAPFQPSEFPDLLGVPWLTPYEAADVLWAVHANLPPWLIRGILADGLCAAQTEGDPDKRLRLVLVPKDEAEAFVSAIHSKLPDWNYRGLIYTIGIKVGYRLVAVAVATTPSGPFKPRDNCSADGVLELSRIASDGTVIGASSKLAARVLDLLPQSGRRGVPGCLFVTYSLVEEKGTTYLALADKGLRPVGLTGGRSAPSGARKSAGYGALPHLKKIVWEAGPAAKPADWSLLSAVATPERLAGAAQALERFEQRQAKQRK